MYVKVCFHANVYLKGCWPIYITLKERVFMKRNKKLVTSILVVALLASVLMSVVLTFIGLTNIKSAYYDSFAEELHAEGLLVNNSISNMVIGDWTENKGILYKGQSAIHDSYQNYLDSLSKETGIQFTIFYGDTRRITTLIGKDGNRLEGSKADPAVIDEVINRGNAYLSTNLKISGDNYYAYYLPIKNTDDSVAGMLFIGRDTADMKAKIASISILMTAILAAFVIMGIVTAFILIKRSNKAIGDIVDSLKKLESGELTFRIDNDTFDRTDELGVIAGTSAELRDKLQDVIRTTIELSDEVTRSGENLSSSAETASQVSEQVANAVGEISKGAVSQAQNIQNSMNNTIEMGNHIDEITAKVEGLSLASDEMKDGTSRTVTAIDSLMTHNENVKASMHEIGKNINSTHDAVNDIAEASGIITSIAEQTNLLSLNASIEAARAGEYGRGFSVVANEIRGLADQSKTAAEKINRILNNLVSQSEASVTTIAKLDEVVKAQNEQLIKTKNDMDSVVVNVDKVDGSTKVIAAKAEGLEKLKDSFSSIIEELSAISEENAASTEETNASMEELSATSAVISESAMKLKDLAEKLNGKMNYFNIESGKIVNK